MKEDGDWQQRPAVPTGRRARKISAMRDFAGRVDAAGADGPASRVATAIAKPAILLCDVIREFRRPCAECLHISVRASIRGPLALTQSCTTSDPIVRLNLYATMPMRVVFYGEQSGARAGMMIEDRFGGRHSQAADPAVAAFERAVWNVLAHRPDASIALDEATALSPDMVAAHALRGFSGVTLARRETIAAARDAYAHARALFEWQGGSAGERTLVEALELAVAGRLLDAAARLEAHCEQAPRDLLAFKLAHALRFMGGDARGMLASAHDVLKHWSADLDGYGFVLGCHAFALEGPVAMPKRKRLAATRSPSNRSTPGARTPSAMSMKCGPGRASAYAGSNRRARCGAAAIISPSTWPGTWRSAIWSRGDSTSR